jgi:antitoxin ParD1/3/4
MKSSEDRPQALREMLIRGEESGIAEYSYKEFIAELDEKTHEVKHAQQWLD